MKKNISKKFVLTFDIDWAPDYAIEHCLNLLEQNKVSATFFATHSTPMNSEIRKRGHILGIHPNFLPNSSHGKSINEIIDSCLCFTQDAWCMRSHALVQSTPLLFEIFSKFPQLKLDVSLLMHRSKFAHKCIWEFNGIAFERILYNWEDDLEFSKQRYCSEKDLFFGDLTVYDFHPIHVVLNSSNGSEYKKLKENLNGEHLINQKKQNILRYKNSKIGIEDHLKTILKSDALCTPLDQI